MFPAILQRLLSMKLQSTVDSLSLYRKEEECYTIPHDLLTAKPVGS